MQTPDTKERAKPPIYNYLKYSHHEKNTIWYLSRIFNVQSKCDISSKGL